MITEKKNQHYIPKFYLKNFSYQNNKKQIGIYNLKSDFYYQKSKLKTQGSKNFFYGKDGVIEDHLSKIEGVLATVIRTIISEEIIPKKNSAEHKTLLHFVALTHLRNPVLINFIINGRKEMQNKLLGLDKNIKEIVPDISHEESIAMSLSSVPMVIDLILDLEYKLLINQTKNPFITSDFPVIKYNQYLEDRKWEHGKTAYGNIGLQIFIPLTSKITIVFYDSMIYKFSFKKRKVMEITNENDIDQLNILQVMNCFETVYFNEEVKEHYLKRIIKEASKFNKANEVLSELGNLKKDIKGNQIITLNNNKKQKNLIMMGSTDCEINLKINGLKTLSSAKNKKLSSSIAQVRPHIRKRHKEYR